MANEFQWLSQLSVRGLGLCPLVLIGTFGSLHSTVRISFSRQPIHMYEDMPSSSIGRS